MDRVTSQRCPRRMSATLPFYALGVPFYALDGGAVVLP